MSVPTLAEAAQYVGTVDTDPRLERALTEAVELLTDRLGADQYAAAATTAPAAFWRMHCDVTKACYERGRTPAGPVTTAPVRGTRGPIPGPLDVVASDLERLDANLAPRTA